MPAKEEDLQAILEDVFAYVPTSDEAIKSSREVVETYLRNAPDLSNRIRWAEFENDTSFVRSGTSHFDAMFTQMDSDWRADAIIVEMVERIKDGSLTPGKFEKALTADGYFWCVPYMARGVSAMPESRQRVVLLTEALFSDLFDIFNEKAGLTGAEKRMLFQLLAGMNPSDAAMTDGVSVETKRSQLKKATAKLDCNSQREVIRLVVGQMVHVLYLCEAETSDIECVENFTSKYLRSHAVLSVMRLHNGRLMRYWELGPEDGKPLLMIHGYLFPFVLLNAKAELARLGYRLLVPVRGGYLDEQTEAHAFHQGHLIDQTIDDLAAFAKAVSTGPMPVFCQGTGGHYALLLAAAYPAVFSRIVITTINLLKGDEKQTSPGGRFLASLRKLAGESGMYKVVAQQFQRRVFSNDKATRLVLRRLFSGSQGDLDALNGMVGLGDAFTWYRALHAGSGLGIPSDFNLMSHPNENLLDQVPADIAVHFIHGSTDTFSSVDQLRTYITARKGSQLRVIEGAGQFAAASHTGLFWGHLEALLTQDP